MGLRTTVVGCGAVAQRLYRKPLVELEKRGILRVVHLVDPIAAHAEGLGASFPAAVRHATLGEALGDGSTDLTLILSPAQLHCEQTLEALAAGSHVLCEKPMANAAVDCERMNAAARQAGRVLAVGMVRRFFPAFAHLRRVVEDGRLGDLLAFEYREGHKFDWDVTTPAPFRPRHLGGTGVLFDIGPHVIDYLSWVFGELSVRAYADDALDGIEANIAMEVASPHAPGAVHLAWDGPQPNELRVVGSRTEAVLRVDRFDQLALSGVDGYLREPVDVGFAADVHPVPRRWIVPASYPQAVFCQIVQVVRAILLGEAPAVDGGSGARTIALLEDALAQARPLRMPWADTQEQQAYATLHWRTRS